MNLLAFDTSLNKTYITFQNDENIVSKVIESDENNYHSAYLISSIAEILKQNNTTPEDLNALAVNVGPGSFTGIRACVTVARVLAQQLNLKIVGISSLEILSKLNKSNKKTLVMLDARKNKAYVWDNKVLGAIDIEKCQEMLTQDVCLVCDKKLAEVFKDINVEKIIFETSEEDLGKILLKIASEKLTDTDKAFNWSELKPLYIQPPPIFGK